MKRIIMMMIMKIGEERERESKRENKWANLLEAAMDVRRPFHIHRICDLNYV